MAAKKGKRQHIPPPPLLLLLLDPGSETRDLGPLFVIIYDKSNAHERDVVQDMAQAKLTRCNHMFHAICLRKWLYMQVRYSSE
jgi:hypothetical protein